MGNSDSDSESECFESAEESLDETEEIKSVETNSKNEEAVPEAAYENVDSTPQAAKEISGNSTSYRKRPDRMKRPASNTTTKHTSKLLSADAVFKSEKIVPDAFFQDITSNLSKNINKSLNTLQQKSSNVKDLILSSLPVSSINENEGFSYDDTVEIMPYENKTQVEEEAKNKGHSGQLIRDTVEKVQSFKERKLTEEMNYPVLESPSSSNRDRKPPDIISKGLHEGNFNLKPSKTTDNIETNVTRKERESIVDSLKNRGDKGSSEEKMESLLEEKMDNLEISDSTFFNSKKMLHKVEGADISVIRLKQPVNFLPHKSHLSEISDITSELMVKDSNDQKCGINTFLKSSELNQLPFDNCKLIDSEVSSPFTCDESLVKHLDNNKHKGELGEQKLEIKSECNLEELKTVLENIVQDKKTNLQENVEVARHKSAEENISLREEEAEFTPISNDGWDDFDFDDNDVENIVANKADIKGTDVKEEKPRIKSVAAVEKISFHGNKRITQPPMKSPNNNSESNIEEKSDLMCTAVSERPKKILEPEPVDTWDWDDNWDETPEEKNDKYKSEKVLHTSSDISKWVGWDTFAQKPQEKQGNWGLGSWGMDMLLNKATAVTQGISNVLEAGLGAPDPGTLAKMEKMERDKLKDLETEVYKENLEETSKKNSLPNVNLFPVSGITSLVAGVTSKIVEHSKIQEIGSKVITGGLDTLETFGKKTMEVLQEGDPGLKNKRALLMGNNKPILSQVLKEAREKAERETKEAEEKEVAKKCHFETLFDDFQGMVHLEALEMLSRQCELKLEQIKSGMNSEEQEDLNGILEEVEQLCSLDECELDFKSSVLDFKSILQMAVEPLKNEISVYRIIQIHENVNEWLQMSSQTECSVTILNQKLVSTLAELAAATVQQFHKSGELLSVKECRKTVEEVDVLSRLTNLLCTEINQLCEKFILLSHNKSSAGDNLNSMTVKVNVVMKNSVSYIKQAFDLLIPVIQLGAAV